MPTEPTTKVCITCGDEKPIGAFRVRTDNGRRRNQCRECRRAAQRRADRRRRQRRAGILPPEPPPDPAAVPFSKVCRVCGIRKFVPEFNLRYESGRRRNLCRVCLRQRNRDYYARHRQRICRTMKERRRQMSPEDRAERRARRKTPVKDPAKETARHRTHKLRDLGLLHVSDTCLDCGGPATLLHHRDYGDITDVVSLCDLCHMRRHFAVWRRDGGGPVKYPEEYEEG
jgi:hypothetical protein